MESFDWGKDQEDLKRAREIERQAGIKKEKEGMKINHSKELHSSQKNRGTIDFRRRVSATNFVTGK